MSEGQLSLNDKEVWIVDDDIPVEQAEFEHDDMLKGVRPIDRGALLSLLKMQNWNDDRVRSLCEELTQKAGNVTAFISPSYVAEHLDKGAKRPDVIVYDLRHRTLAPEKVQKALKEILERCISVVQVYTQESEDEANKEIQDLIARFPNRLVNPKNKSLSAADLTKILEGHLQSSLSAGLASTLRRLALSSVENVLLQIDDLPITVAITLLAGEEEPEEADLIELISVKVSESINASPDLADAVNKYAIAKGVPQSKVFDFAQEISFILASHLKEHIRNNGGLINEVRSVWRKTITVKGKKVGQTDSRIIEIIRDFTAFRLYTRPADGMVRTGDVIVVKATQEKDQNPPDLYLVLTPPCDLERFWKKTRGSLTLVKMHPLDERGSKKLRLHGNSDFGIKNETISSIISRGTPIILPSILGADGENKRYEYALFAHDIYFKEIEKIGMTSDTAQLTYKDLGAGFELRCHISEPFLSGILSEIRNIIFRPGVPDFPVEETTRLEKLFKDLKDPQKV